MSDASPTPTDNPIKSSAEDVLGRAGLAHDFARQVRALDASEGAVVGVLGPWGHGKSSFINLMREEFETQPIRAVIDFNPWMFSGTEQLVDHFFFELAENFKELKDSDLTRAARLLEEYGESISSVARLFGITGQLLAGGIGLTKRAAKRHLENRGSAGTRRQKIADELAKLPDPVIVVIDDIDRLTTNEIREIFKLVRLTANFPNIIYILSFDRARVEAALEEANVPGRAYLEKIVQVAFDLPAAPDRTLMSAVLEELQKVLTATENENFDAARWPDVFAEVIYPLIENMRDVSRLSLSVRPTILSLATDIEIVDLFALEAIRVFRPELFFKLRTMRKALTDTGSSFGGKKENSDNQRRVEELLDIAGDEAEVVRSLLHRLFPAATKYLQRNHYGPEWAIEWKKSSRVASLVFLNMYFDRVAPDELRVFRIAKSLVDLMIEPSRFYASLHEIDKDEVTDVLGALGSLREDYPSDNTAPAIACLLNLIHDIPEDPTQSSGILHISPDVTVLRIVNALIEKKPEGQPREALIASALASVTAYSSKLELVFTVGHRDGIGAKLVSNEFAKKLESELANEIKSSPPSEFDAEWDLARVYSFYSDYFHDSSPLAQELRPEVTRSVLESVKSFNRAQTMGDRRVSVTPVLAWDWLVNLYGNETILEAAVNKLHESDGDSSIVSLAIQYLSGWRPDYGPHDL